MLMPGDPPVVVFEIDAPAEVVAVVAPSHAVAVVMKRPSVMFRHAMFSNPLDTEGWQAAESLPSCRRHDSVGSGSATTANHSSTFAAHTADGTSRPSSYPRSVLGSVREVTRTVGSKARRGMRMADSSAETRAWASPVEAEELDRRRDVSEIGLSR